MSPESPWLRGGVVVLMVLLVQEGLLYGVRIDGIRPELLLAAGIVGAVMGTPEAGAVLAFVAGLVADVFVTTPFGLTALVASVVAYAAGSIQQALGVSNRWSVPLLTAGASVAAVLAWAALGTVLGLPRLVTLRLIEIAGVVGAANALFAIPLAPVMRWVYAGVPTAAAGPGGSGSRGYLP